MMAVLTFCQEKAISCCCFLVVGLMRLIHFATAAGGCSLTPNGPIGRSRSIRDVVNGSKSRSSMAAALDVLRLATVQSEPVPFRVSSYCNNEIDLLQVWARSTMAGICTSCDGYTIVLFM